jgi:hypothetical protein
MLGSKKGIMSWRTSGGGKPESEVPREFSFDKSQNKEYINLG